MLLRLLGSKDFVALKHKIKTVHVGSSSKILKVLFLGASLVPSNRSLGIEASSDASQRENGLVQLFQTGGFPDSAMSDVGIVIAK